MVVHFYMYHHSSDLYVDFIDLYVALIVIYADFSDHYMSFCPNKNHHNKEKSLWSQLWRILTWFKKKSLVPKRLHFLIFNWVLAPLIWECKWGFHITNCLSFSVNELSSPELMCQFHHFVVAEARPAIPWWDVSERLMPWWVMTSP